MEDSLKHARLLHYLLIGATITAISLALARHSDLVERYDLAISEVEIVRGLVGGDWREGGDSPRNNFEPLSLATIRAVRGRLDAQVAEFVAADFTSELQLRAPTTRVASVTWDMPMEYLKDLPITATVKEILGYFDSIPIMAVVPDFDDLARESRVLQLPSPDGSILNIAGHCRLNLKAYGEAAGWSVAGKGVPLKLRIRARDSQGRILAHEMFVTQGRPEPVPGFSKQQGLLKSYRYFAAVLPHIADLTPDQARLRLEEKIAAVPNTASFLGVSVPRSMTAVAVAVVIGLVVLLTHSIIHLNYIVQLEADIRGEVAAFSWVALFSGKWARCFSMLTILVLPAGTVALLGWASILSLGARASLISLALACVAVGLTLTLSNSAWVELQRLICNGGGRTGANMALEPAGSAGGSTPHR
jgi:hypothetical protein